MNDDKHVEPSAANTRSVELIVALLIVAVGALVIIDSHRVGIGWADDGPRAGYFPNMIGWILTVVGLWIAGDTLRHWKQLAGKAFVTRAALKPVLAMFLPTVVYVVLLRYVGIYLASALYIAAFMHWQGRYRWPSTLAVSIGVPIVIFFLFEIWFLVPLPKGPIERLLGF